jgi:hypothetical protein
MWQDSMGLKLAMSAVVLAGRGEHQVFRRAKCRERDALTREQVRERLAL